MKTISEAEEKLAIERRECYKSLATEELYGSILDKYVRLYRISNVGKSELERKIGSYMKHGLNREEAIRKLAVDELM